MADTKETVQVLTTEDIQQARVAAWGAEDSHLQRWVLVLCREVERLNREVFKATTNLDATLNEQRRQIENATETME
jgi:hypothetical protein